MTPFLFLLKELKFTVVDVYNTEGILINLGKDRGLGTSFQNKRMILYQLCHLALVYKFVLANSRRGKINATWELND